MARAFCIYGQAFTKVMASQTVTGAAVTYRVASHHFNTAASNVDMDITKRT